MRVTHCCPSCWRRRVKYARPLDGSPTGMRLTIFIAIGSSRDTGMRLPASGWPLSGSFNGVRTVAKSPARWAAVGEMEELLVGAARRFEPCHETKKNVLFLAAAPPAVKPY